MSCTMSEAFTNEIVISYQHAVISSQLTTMSATMDMTTFRVIRPLSFSIIPGRNFEVDIFHVKEEGVSGIMPSCRKESSSRSLGPITEVLVLE